MPGPQAVVDAAEALLAASVAALTLTTRGFNGVAYLTPGLPAFDFNCDFVVVWQGALALAPSATLPASQRMRTGPRVNEATLNVTVGRCARTGTDTRPPTPTQQQADALVHMEDSLTLWDHLTAEVAAGNLFSLCSRVTFGQMTAITPQGGLAGWNLPIVVQADS